MSNRTKIIAGAVGLACLMLTGCVSEGGSYSRGGYAGYNPVYERSDRSDRYWRNRRDRDRNHDRGPRNGYGDRGRNGMNQAAYARDKPDPTWAGNGPRGRDNGPGRGDAGRSGGRDILIPNQ
ncbi:hypothetical protein EPK99_09095 [Neorhizobium lilium]|uniref:Lipoprotein n=1 Tax=Neorhizobium lilium TaxID=2503024 RepID=A0A444LI89_9HYPH|nr:hypothetical protein [Neorhizobium lilium]RWX78738.1 hypothetical protein EPK99_09095 [Neorhizobium lilium]